MVWFTDEAINQNIKISDIYKDSAPMSGKVLKKALEWMANAERFRIEIPLIPYGGEEKILATVDRFAHGLVMPNKFVCIEYEHGGAYDMKPDLTRALSTRRIALCVDLESIHGVTTAGIEKFVRDKDDDGGILIWSINYFDEKREWEISPGAAIIPRRQVRDYLLKSKVGTSKYIDYMKKSLVNRKEEDVVMDVSYINMFPEVCEKLGEEHRLEIIKNSNMDAVWVALGFFSAITCRNVRIDPDSRSAVMQEVRVAGLKNSPEVPLDPFHGFRSLKSLSSDVWRQGSKINFS